MAENRDDFNDSVMRLRYTIAWDVWLGLLVWKVQVRKPVGYWKDVFGGDYDFGTDGCYFYIFRERMYFKLGKEYDCSGHKH